MDELLTTGEQTGIIAVGITVAIAAGAGIWRAGVLRGDVSSKWTRRVDFAVVALEEKTVSELEQLRDEIDNLLPSEQEFDPVHAIADPAPLTGRVERTARYYRVRKRMEADLVVLRRLGPALVAGLGTLEVGTVALTIHYADLAASSWLQISGAALVALAIAILIVVTVAHTVLQHRLSTGEILAGTGGRTDAT